MSRDSQSGTLRSAGGLDYRWVFFIPRGKSGLLQAVQRVTPFHRKVRNSGTERMSRAMSLGLGTGDPEGAAGVKAAKLCTEQDQIGRQ